jgi:hypothetical protein
MDSAVAMTSWWSLPMTSATRRAASRSLLSLVPTAKVGRTSPRRRVCSAAIVATIAESSPPERNTPTPTSLIIRRCTDSTTEFLTFSSVALSQTGCCARRAGRSPTGTELA